MPQVEPGEVFVSYSSLDLDRVSSIVRELEDQGVTVWRDGERILGGDCYGPAIVDGIEHCTVLMLMCSASSMRSRNVKQEIQLAWRYGRPYLPLLLDDSIGRAYPKQVQYWLEGCQWIEVLDRPAGEWLPAVLRALERVRLGEPETAADEVAPTVVHPAGGLAGLRRVAAYSDQIWPVPADLVARGVTRGAVRGLGAPQPSARYGHPLGSRVRLVIESEREGHLLLIDEGPDGITYCLCPSWFAPDTRLLVGKSVLPQEGSAHESFLVTGVPGREHLLAIVTDEPLDMGWMPEDEATPARVLQPGDIARLLTKLQSLRPERWTALATWFDVLST
jgi:hypothetical protein